MFSHIDRQIQIEMQNSKSAQNGNLKRQNCGIWTCVSKFNLPTKSVGSYNNSTPFWRNYNTSM